MEKRVMELFNSSQFSSLRDATRTLDDAARDFEVENISSKKKVGRCLRQPYGTHSKVDPAWDNGSAFPEVSSLDFKVGDAGDGKSFKVGDRVTTSHPLCKGKVYTIGIYPSIDATGKVHYDWIETTCNLLLRCDSLTFVQESAQDSVTPACNSDLALLEPQKPTDTVTISSSIDTQECITTETCEASPLTEDSDLNREQSTSLQLLPPVPPSQEKDSDSVQVTAGIASPQFCGSLRIISQNSQPLKTLPGCSTAPHTQENQQAHILEAYSGPLTASGTMRNGLLWELDMLEVPLLEKESCWLPSPGALSSTGKGRPPGQTKQEGELKKLGLLQKNEVLNPAILCQWYEIPQTWLDPSESRAATELLENNERQQEICLIPELQQLHLVESFISTKSDIKLLSTQEIIEALSISEDELDEFWNNEPALFKGFKIQWLGATIQKWRVESENRLPQSESIPEKSSEDERQSPSIEPLNLSLIEDNGTPEKFLEESTADTKQLPSRKRRQRKGCLYKYLENKKLKNGNIASYPRVIGETRDPDNPKHWRWGFNWEEKIDGEWKGRSIGSVPIGAIALIQSMQKSGVPLEEIIAFIRRSKNKA
jgi:hypothetical protein